MVHRAITPGFWVVHRVIIPGFWVVHKAITLGFWVVHRAITLGFWGKIRTYTQWLPTEAEREFYGLSRKLKLEGGHRATLL